MIRWLCTALLFLVVLSACGDDGPEASSSTLAVTTNPDVASLLGTPFTEEEVLADFQSIHARSEELIASCMADAGFDYLPAPFQARAGQPIPTTETSLGVTHQYFGAFSADFEPPPDNPNVAIQQSLADDERTNYNRVLEGESSVFDPRFETDDAIRDGLDSQPSIQDGCRFEAQQVALAETGRNQELIDEYSRLRAGLFQSDQGVFRARVEWAQCMAEAGFTYRDEDAMRGDLNGQALAVLQDLVELRDQGVDLVPMQDPPPQAAELIDALRQREAEVASVHVVCREPLDAALAEVRAEADAIFLERNS